MATNKEEKTLLELYHEDEIGGLERENLYKSFDPISKWIRVKRTVDPREVTHILYAGYGFVFKIIEYDL